MKLSLLILFAFQLLLCQNQLKATHLRGGHIEFKSISSNSLTYEIKVIITNDSGSEVLPGAGELNLGDGNFIDLSKEARLEALLLENQFGIYTLIIEHTYAAPGQYIISYSERNRNAGVKNISNSVDTSIYFETMLTIDPFLGKNNSPAINNQFLKSFNRIKTLYNPEVSDEDGDSISYHLVIPKQESEVEVFDYQFPNNPDFYHSNSYFNGLNNGPPTFSISPFDGNMVWDVAGLSGEYSAAIKVKEWRKVEGEVFNISSIVYDFQMTIDENDMNLIGPTFLIPETQCYDDNLAETIQVETNGQLTKVELFTDAENAQINGIPVQEFTFSEEYTTEDFALEYTLDVIDATKPYHQVVVSASQKSEDGTVYKWSQGYTFGFGCETIQRVITSIPPEQNKHQLHVYHHKGELSLNTESGFSGIGELIIYDMNGKTILISNELFNKGKTSLRAPILNNGIYLLAIKSKEGNLKGKFLVNN